MMIPLVARDLVLGMATFYRTRPLGPFDNDDSALAAQLAARAAISIDNARLYHREHDTAVTLQRSMLPQHITPPPGIEVAHRYLPASDANEVGGDWYDVLHLPGGKAALLIGDVMGHGIAAAAVMGRLSASVRALARLDLDPQDILAQLEAALEDMTEPMLTTLLYAVVDPATGHCRLTRAGHPRPRSSTRTAKSDCSMYRRARRSASAAPATPPPTTPSSPAASSCCTPTGSSNRAPAISTNASPNSPTP